MSIGIIEVSGGVEILRASLSDAQDDGVLVDRDVAWWRREASATADPSLRVGLIGKTKV